MNEQQDRIERLEAAGVLMGIRWAFLSAAHRVMEDFSEAAGHDPTWVGVTRFTLFRDRLDRVFSCGRYTVASRDDARMSLDMLYAELSRRDIDTFPQVAPDLVERSDLRGSAGWSHDGTRWLLASSGYGKLDELPWSQKSDTKQRVARQPSDSPNEPSLFDQFTNEELAELEPATVARQLDLHTLIVGHSQDIVLGGLELVMGQPRMNSAGGSAWYWKSDLLQTRPPEGELVHPSAPSSTGPTPVPDALVKLRKPAVEQPNHEQVQR